jgi:hypothetical protein
MTTKLQLIIIIIIIIIIIYSDKYELNRLKEMQRLLNFVLTF